MPVPTHLLPGGHDSTEKNPIAIFDYLISRNGLAHLRSDFIPTSDDYEHYYNQISYDPKTETKTFEDQDSETGEWETIVTTFQSVLRARLYQELMKSLGLIDDRINTFGKKKDIKHFIVLTLCGLRSLT